MILSRFLFCQCKAERLVASLTHTHTHTHINLRRYTHTSNLSVSRKVNLCLFLWYIQPMKIGCEPLKCFPERCNIVRIYSHRVHLVFSLELNFTITFFQDKEIWKILFLKIRLDTILLDNLCWINLQCIDKEKIRIFLGYINL